MIDVDNWPSFSEELGRKVSTQLERWAAFYDAGRISKREFFILVDALYETSSGLAPKEVSFLLADIHRDLRARKNGKAA